MHVERKKEESDMQNLIMVGGCKVVVGMIPRWALVDPKCIEKGVCQCIGKRSPLLLDGTYEGFGKRV